MRRKIFIIGDNPGRLGNLINRHGHLLAFAAEHGHMLIDVSFLNSARFFPTLNRNLLQGYPRLPAPPLPLIVLRIAFWCFRRFLWIAPQLERLTGGLIQRLDAPYPVTINLENPDVKAKIDHARILLLTGYLFEANGSFKRHGPLIRNQFSVLKSIQATERAFFGKFRNEASEIVGVHIRHTDFRTYCDGRWYYTTQQYAKVMKWYADHFPDRKILFVICSDEQQGAEAFEGLSVYVHRGNFVSDWHALSLCDRIISTASSFARAAAFLGDVPLLQIYNPDAPETHRFLKVEVLEEGWKWHGQMLEEFGQAPGALR